MLLPPPLAMYQSTKPNSGDVLDWQPSSKRATENIIGDFTFVKYRFG
jgi:hypothetical protein